MGILGFGFGRRSLRSFKVMDYTHSQKQGYSGAQDEARDHVRAVVPILRDPVEARQEGRAEGPEAQHWLGQSTALRFDCACDVHRGI